jgi:hypothetical protein
VLLEVLWPTGAQPDGHRHTGGGHQTSTDLSLSCSIQLQPDGKWKARMRLDLLSQTQRNGWAEAALPSCYESSHNDGEDAGDDTEWVLLPGISKQGGGKGKLRYRVHLQTNLKIDVSVLSSNLTDHAFVKFTFILCLKQFSWSNPQCFLRPRGRDAGTNAEEGLSLSLVSWNRRGRSRIKIKFNTEASNSEVSH